MSKFMSRFMGWFVKRSQVGIDKAGNRYFTRTEEIDGRMKERRWVEFKVEQDPRSIPVEWICWLNRQRKSAPTPEEMLELEVRREEVKMNVEKLRKEEEEKKAKGIGMKSKPSSGIGRPDIESFLKQLPGAPAGSRGDASDVSGATADAAERPRSSDEAEVAGPLQREPTFAPTSSEPSGSGQSYKPGTWQPPS